MALRGVDSPKFVYDNGGGSEDIVLLDYAVITKNKPTTKYIMNESELDLDRKFNKKGTHYEVEFRINLFKYGTQTQQKAKFDEIIQYLGQEVSLWLHRDGDQFKQSGGSDALFVFKSYEEIYLTQKTYKDGIIITFESVNPVDQSYGVSAEIMPSEIIMGGGSII